MAERGLSTVVAHAVVGLMEWTWPRLRPSARQIFERVAEAARPDPPLHLCSSDGQESLTGVAVMNRGHVLGFVGSRHRAPSSFRSEPRSCVGDEALWREEMDPYRR